MRFQSVLMALSAITAASAAVCTKRIPTAQASSSAQAVAPTASVATSAAAVVASSTIASTEIASSSVVPVSSSSVPEPATSSVAASSVAASSVAAISTAAATTAAVEATSTPAAASSVASTSAAAASSSATMVTSVAVEASSTSAAASTVSSTSAAAASSSAVSTTSNASGGLSGEATFYGGNLSGGTCSFTTLSSIPNTLFGTAFSGAEWNDAAECGVCVEIAGPAGSSITAMIVDECPECNQGHFDLFEDAFLELGTAAEGVIDITYSFVSCGITTPIVLANKSGTSAYWFSMQVVNSNVGVESLEVSTDSGSTWQSTTRSSYNFFENSSGFGTATVDVRVTSTSGEVITVSGVSVASEAQATAASNFS